MKYILMVFLLISFAFGQDTKVGYTEGTVETRTQETEQTIPDSFFVINYKTPIVNEYPYELWKRMFDEKGLIQVTFEYDDIKIDTYFPTIRSYEIYAEECYNDTIKAIPFESEFLIDNDEWGSMLEMVTEKQLEKRGYFYQYRWITNTIIDEEHPMEMEYIFVKEPTLKGFIEWLKESKQ